MANAVITALALMEYATVNLDILELPVKESPRKLGQCKDSLILLVIAMAHSQVLHPILKKFIQVMSLRSKLNSVLPEQ